MMMDENFMQLALFEARKGLGLTCPNPPVGSVIVRDGEVIARGWHRKAGGPHAEREAIKNAGEGTNLTGATIYVTLEPCSTCGRTAACTDAIIEAGFSRVVYGSRDVNPDHIGAADEILKSVGIEVVSGILEEECEELIRGFSKRMLKGLPWVIAKSAMSLDGRITRPEGEGQWLTGAEARVEAHRIRAEVDAIVVGGKTVRRDDPSLSIRGEAYRSDKEQPWRVVLTQSGRQNLPVDAVVFTDEFKDRTLIHEDMSLESSLRELAERGCNTVLLECGGVLMRQFLEQGLVDEVAVFFAPMLTGGGDFGFGVGEHLKKSLALEKIQVKQLGDDVLFRGVVRR
ncbi:MAG: diaminohydroxyphosphoribosylaminopyrimidine deaminase [Rubritalea sp.]|jgi:diaminohydroxyphosphoribosylaminopyrimidine deaminase/5-amino-6-(5-phosphoribosylamino)uracil reductase